MSKQSQFKKILAWRHLLAIGVSEIFFIILGLILYFTIEKQIASNVFFALLAFCSLIGFFSIFQFRSAKRKIYFKLYKDPRFLDNNTQFKVIIDEFYNDVFYDLDALLGAYFRRLIRNVIISFVLSISCLVISLLFLI